MQPNWKGIYACLAIITICFATVGCAGVYKAIGLTQEQTAEQVGEDQVMYVRLIEQGRGVFWQVATAVLGGLGTVATGVLGKYLHTERKITKAAILGIERNDGKDVKGAVKDAAKKLGVTQPLAKRVDKITG